MTLRFSLTPLSEIEGACAALKSFLNRVDGSIFQHAAYINQFVKLALPYQPWLLEGKAGNETVLLAIIGHSVGKGGIRTLHLNESGNDKLDALYPEYNDFWLLPGAPPEAREAALRYLLMQEKIDSLLVRNSMPGLAEAVRSVAQEGYPARTLKSHASWQVDLKGFARDGIFPGVSNNTARQIKRAFSLYQARGEVTVQAAQSPEEIEDAWQLMSTLHQDAWLQKNLPGAFDNPAFCSFHRKLLADTPGHGTLLQIRAGTRPIGVLYFLIREKTVYAYQSGLSQEEDNRLKPGLVSHFLACQNFAAKGYETYDLLAGDDRYKKSIAIEATPMGSYEIEKRTLRTRARALYKSLRALTGRTRAKNCQT